MNKPYDELIHQIKEVNRELAMRKAVYPNQIKNKKLSEEKANFQYEALKRLSERLLKAVEVIMLTGAKQERREGVDDRIIEFLTEIGFVDTAYISGDPVYTFLFDKLRDYQKIQKGETRE